MIREFSVGSIVYVTTLLEGKKYHKKELAAFYTRRWIIELDFRNLKTNMKMDMLRCKSPDMVKKELAVYLLAYNIIRASIARAAKRKDKIHRQINYMTAVQVFNEGVIKLFLLVGKVLKNAINGLLTAITSLSIGQQKRKAQPRVVKRRPKAYLLLKMPRKMAAQAINI